MANIELSSDCLERFPIDVSRNGHGGFPHARKSDSCFPVVNGGGTMAKGYSTDLRERVVAIVESGESAREAARLLDLGASTAIRWIERWTTTGSVAAKPGTGHTRSPLEQHKQWLIDLVAAEPDLTLAEIRIRLAREKKLNAGATSIWRFYERHAITFKKNPARRRAGSA
jgi:transposase